MAAIYFALKDRYSPMEVDQWELWQVAAVLGRGTRVIRHKKVDPDARPSTAVEHLAPDGAVDQKTITAPVVVARAKGARP